MFTERLEDRRLFSSVSFTYDPSAGTSNPHKLRFDLDVSAVPTGTFLNLANVSTGNSIRADSVAGTWTGGASAIFTFPTYSNGVTAGVLPDGNYFGGLIDPANPGTPLLTSEFFVFTADAGHDRSVSSSDFNALVANYGGSSKTFSQGDFNYNGKVDTLDFNLLAGHFGGTVAAPAGIQLAVTALDTANLMANWTSVSGATGYRLQYSLNGGTSFVDSAELQASPLSAQVIDLDPGVLSCLKITAFDGSGDLATSELANATTVQVVPGQPGNLTAAPGMAGSVDLNWWDVSENESAYVVQRATDSSFTTNLTTFPALAANSESYSDTSVPGTGTYYYRAFASNSAGNSPYSNTASITFASFSALPVASTSEPAEAKKSAGSGNLDGPTTLLLAMNGADLDMGNNSNGTHPIGNYWFDELARQAGTSIRNSSLNIPYKYVYRSWPGNQVNTAMHDLFAQIDINSDKHITAAEVANVRVMLTGFSLGGIDVINISRKLNGKFDPNREYKIDVPIPVEDLVSIDPVRGVAGQLNAPLQIAKFVNGAVQTNVGQFTNYYQKKGGGTSIKLYLLGTLNGFFPIYVDDESPINPPAGGLVGDNSFASNAPKTSVNVTADRAGQYATSVDYVRISELADLYTTATHFDADLEGNNVQHDTIVWYVLQDALALIQ